MNIHSVSLLGARKENEDKHSIILNMGGQNGGQKNVNIYAVFDGHGGKQVSQYVNENLPKYFLDKRVQYPVSKNYVVNVYNHLQNSIKKNAYAKHTGSTGLVVVHFKHGEEIYVNIINNGDSRCVLCRDNFAMPLTKDHKPNWPEEYHRITQLGGEIEFDGFDWRIKDLSVSRAFGDLDATPYVTHLPDIFRYRLDKNDKFIVLGCDGLYDVLSNFEIVNFVLINCYDNALKKRHNNFGNIAKKLADFAIKKGSKDNVTVIVVFLD